MIAKFEKNGAQVEAVSMSRSISMGRKPCTRNSFQNGKRLKLRLWRRLAGGTKGDKTQPEGTRVYFQNAFECEASEGWPRGAPDFVHPIEATLRVSISTFGSLPSSYESQGCLPHNKAMLRDDRQS